MSNPKCQFCGVNDVPKQGDLCHEHALQFQKQNSPFMSFGNNNNNNNGNGNNSPNQFPQNPNNNNNFNPNYNNNNGNMSPNQNHNNIPNNFNPNSQPYNFQFQNYSPNFHPQQYGNGNMYPNQNYPPQMFNSPQNHHFPQNYSPLFQHQHSFSNPNINYSPTPNNFNNLKMCKFCNLNPVTPGHEFCSRDHGLKFQKNNSISPQKCKFCKSKPVTPGHEFCSREHGLQFQKNILISPNNLNSKFNNVAMCKLCKLNPVTPGHDFCCREHGLYFEKNFSKKDEKKKCKNCNKQKNKGFDFCSRECGLSFQKQSCRVCKKSKKTPGYQTCANSKCIQQAKNNVCRYCKKTIQGSCKNNDCKRKRALHKGPTMTLYHQTDKDSALLILDSRKMLRGTTGLAGGGIYFATTASHTEHKAHKKGVILKAKVYLGNVFTTSPNGDNSITYASLLSKGFHSVKIPRVNGEEYVVYNYDQVKKIRIEKKN